MPLTLSSPAFSDGERIPDKYTREGKNASPPLRWSGAPEGTKSFVLIVDDPDAPSGTFHHWGLFNMPAGRDQLPESVETGGTLRQARNDFGNTHYDGPQPPPGTGTHHYRFRLGALDVPSLSVPPQSGIERTWEEARKHMLEETQLVGTR